MTTSITTKPSFLTKGCLIKEANDGGTEQKKELKFPRCLAPPVMAAILTLSTPCFITTPAVSQAQPVDVVHRGSSLFQKACIGCHVGGGNIIQPGATLFMKDLERNGVSSEDELYKITYYGKGRMPGFGENCTPRGQCTFGPRLQDEEIKLLAEFVKLQADKGWSVVESNSD